jgi:mRNA interferase MazF
MKRAEVWWVNFGPSLGGEIRKVRPAVIVSNNAANKFLNRVQVVPITSRTDRVYPSEVLVTIEGKQGKALADQIATDSKVRLSKRIATLSPEDIRKVGNVIKIHLDLD